MFFGVDRWRSHYARPCPFLVSSPPFRWNGHVFVDGGLLDNLPVDVTKEMGADITLAIHLQIKQLEPEQPMSAFGVLGQSGTTVIAANELRSIEEADLLVSVPLQKFTSSDYLNADAIIEAGYKAIDAKATMLSGLSVDDQTWNAYLADRASRRRTAPTPGFVNVAGTKSALSIGLPITGASSFVIDFARKVFWVTGF